MPIKLITGTAMPASHSGYSLSALINGGLESKKFTNLIWMKVKIQEINSNSGNLSQN
jgi:hypothetical protein